MCIRDRWSFFATSHGKTECDGIGGIVKRLAQKESLQRPLGHQILSPADLFEFCKVNITKVNFHFISKDSVNQIRSDPVSYTHLDVYKRQTGRLFT